MERHSWKEIDELFPCNYNIMITCDEPITDTEDLIPSTLLTTLIPTTYFGTSIPPTMLLLLIFNQEERSNVYGRALIL